MVQMAGSVFTSAVRLLSKKAAAEFRLCLSWPLIVREINFLAMNRQAPIQLHHLAHTVFLFRFLKACFY
jgi:hypothetical protein